MYRLTCTAVKVRSGTGGIVPGGAWTNAAKLLVAFVKACCLAHLWIIS